MVAYHHVRLALVVAAALFLMAGSFALVQAREPAALYSPGQQEEPTPDPCQVPILQPTLDRVNVRSGPGLSYPAIADLFAGESAAIIGRAEYVQWWQIELPSGIQGWVGDEVVLVSGNIDGVPIVEPPPLEGEDVDEPEPTPWNPVADAECPATATPAPVEAGSTITQAATPTPTASWSSPVNLSQSGAAMSFRTVVTATGTIHVLWQETGIDSFLYVRGFGEEWSQPSLIEVPFGTTAYYPDLQEGDPTPLFYPELVAEDNGRIHAFWTDDEANLHYSRAAAGAFESFEAWTSRETLAEGVLVAKAVADAGGRVHLVYMQSQHTETSPAGVYYRQYNAETDDPGWSEPVLIYQSLYIHAIEAELAHLQITTAENGAVYVVWDNPLLEQVFLARSNDQGLTWQPAMEVDGKEPEDDAEANGPAKIMVGARGNDVVLLWQADHSGTVCGQYYTWSTDGGESWQPRQQLELLAGCDAGSQFFTAGSDRPIFLLTSVLGDAYLLAWEGERWSEPLPQEMLVQFVNPETHQSVDLGCYQGHLLGADELAVFGCNEGDVNDIWYMSRPLGTAQEWFPPPAVWDAPDLAVLNDAEPRDLQLLADAANRLHLIWAQADGEAIRYAVHDDNWSQSLDRLASPDGLSNQPNATLSADDRLLVVWSDPQSGSVYFSAAGASEAVEANAWSSPIAVATVSSVASSPDVEAGRDGVIYVAFAVSLNEGRGIYLTQSNDNGSTWSTPALVYDASTVMRGGIHDPDLFVDGSGQLHLLWHQHRLSPESDPYALYYMSSMDGGENWSSPELVVEEPVRWSAMVSGEGNWLYRIWQVSLDEEATSLEFQSSQDLGRSWSRAGVLANSGGGALPAAVAVDLNKKVHLFQPDRRTMHHWIAAGGSWSSAEGLDLQDYGLRNLTSLAAAIDPSNMVIMAFVAQEADEETGEQQFVVRIASRELSEGDELTPASVAPATTATPPATNTPQSLTAEPTPTPTPTPTRVFPEDFDEANSGLFPFLNAYDQMSGVITGLILTTIIVLVLVAMAFGVKRIRMFANGDGKR